MPKSMSSTTLARWYVAPGEAEPLKVVKDRLLASGEVSRRIRVVDSKEHPIALTAVDDRAERVPNMKRARRARSETHALPRAHPRRDVASASSSRSFRVVLRLRIVRFL